MPVGRPSALADPNHCRAVAEMVVAGYTRKEIAAEFNVKDVDTITKWRRDPRVKNIALKLVEDRVIQIARKIDTTIEARLANSSDLTVTELLAIRKEFLGGALRAQTERADEDTINEATEALENNPEFAAELQKLISKSE